MTAPTRFTCIDRRTGRPKQEPIYAPQFLDWCHNTRAGRALTDMVFSLGPISRLYGWVNRQSWSRRKIEGFCETMGVDLDELCRPLDDFRSFNDLITREINLSKRPIDADPRVCCAPVDGRFLVYPRVTADKVFLIKRLEFDLRTFLRDDRLVAEYDGGAMAVGRLYLADYHHFHFPAAGVARTNRLIPGRYYAVSPYSWRWLVPVFAENRRMITVLETGQFGPIAMVEVGAFTVGSIRQCFTIGRSVAKGEHKGYFELGASLVVLLFKPGAIVFDTDLQQNTAAGLETYLRMGESVGCSQPTTLSRDLS